MILRSFEKFTKKPFVFFREGLYRKKPLKKGSVLIRLVLFSNEIRNIFKTSLLKTFRKGY